MFEVLAQKILPNNCLIYHGAFPDFGGPEDRVSLEKIDEFEDLIGKPIAWAYFSNNWKKGIEFPTEAVRIIHSSGATPFIRLMARTKFEKPRRDRKYRLRRIIAGRFDRELATWADAAKAANIPLMVEFGTEVNGYWFPWNGKWNGKGRKRRYGDPKEADGPERFRDAYRHIVNIFRARNVTNVTWVFHVNGESFPKKKWNTISAYYPGDDYVDWIGVSIYGAQNADEEWVSFRSLLDRAYPKLAALSSTKPLALLEFGVDERLGEPDKKANWIKDALESLASGRYPRIRAVSYWHENWENASGDMSRLRLDSSTEALNAYREGIANDIFIGRLDTSCP
ncbi:MAG: beta-mannanase [Candidatus Dadabacteria bacterium]|nr:MAG: beta-mannanase [Candidatus Dadabacteria bacterium]